jgi:hypothetical protein
LLQFVDAVTGEGAPAFVRRRAFRVDCIRRPFFLSLLPAPVSSGRQQRRGSNGDAGAAASGSPHAA